MYKFAFKIILAILNKSTQYISFIAITLFLTFFLMIKEGLITYEDKFINSLKGLYPEFVTTSKSALKALEGKDVEIVKEIFVYSEEILLSYDGDEDISKFMNIRTYDAKHKGALFSSIDTDETCDANEKTLWLSNRLYNNMAQDNAFDKKHLYFMGNDDEYIEYNFCVFHLANDEKWLVTSTLNAKEMAYMPLPLNTIYTTDKKIKKMLYGMKKVYNWKKYIDYEDLGVFLLAMHVSDVFLLAFFLFLVIFMIITFSSLAKEFEASIFLKKIFGMNIYDTILLLSTFFVTYVVLILVFVLVEHTLLSFALTNVLGTSLSLDTKNLGIIGIFLVLIGIVVSVAVSKKYHRLPF